MGKTTITATLKQQKYKIRRINQRQISGSSRNIGQLFQCPFGTLYEQLSAAGKSVRHLFKLGKYSYLVVVI